MLQASTQQPDDPTVDAVKEASKAPFSWAPSASRCRCCMACSEDYVVTGLKGDFQSLLGMHCNIRHASACDTCVRYQRPCIPVSDASGPNGLSSSGQVLSLKCCMWQIVASWRTPPACLSALVENASLADLLCFLAILQALASCRCASSAYPILVWRMPLAGR